jgi:hypothetical protein
MAHHYEQPECAIEYDAADDAVGIDHMRSSWGPLCRAWQSTDRFLQDTRCRGQDCQLVGALISRDMLPVSKEQAQDQEPRTLPVYGKRACSTAIAK